MNSIYQDKKAANANAAAGGTSTSLAGTASVRRPRPSEAASLTSLAVAAKSFWGYSPSFLDAALPELTITASDISQHDIHVAVFPPPPPAAAAVEGKDDEKEEEEIAGVYRLTLTPPEEEEEEEEEEKFDAVLSYLWIHPDRIGRGLGSLLWEHAMRRAKALGVGTLEVDADPNAEPFYLRMGAARYGEVESGTFKGRMLPLMSVDVEEALALIDRKRKTAGADGKEAA